MTRAAGVRQARPAGAGVPESAVGEGMAHRHIDGSRPADRGVGHRQRSGSVDHRPKLASLPCPVERREHPERATVTATYILRLVDQEPSPGAQLHTVRPEGPAHRIVPGPPVRREVTARDDDRRADRRRHARHLVHGSAGHHHQRCPSGSEPFIEALEAPRQVPQPVGAAPTPIDDDRIDHEQRHDPVGDPERVVERRQVVDPQVAPEPHHRRRSGRCHRRYPRASTASTMRRRLGRTP